METITTNHPLRTITLRFDRAVTAPEFETLALRYYQEIHDRVLAIKQRIQDTRKKVPEFIFQIEELRSMFEDAQRKFAHLKIMVPTNPVRELVLSQLKTLLKRITELADSFVPDMIDTVMVFFDYEDYSFEQEKWMNNVAFPQFREIIKHYKDCSVDMVYFDHDLEDFKGTLRFVKKLEGKFYDEMNPLVDDYSDLNYEMDLFFRKVEDFDETLSC